MNEPNDSKAAFKDFVDIIYCLDITTSEASDAVLRIFLEQNETTQLALLDLMFEKLIGLVNLKYLHKQTQFKSTKLKIERELWKNERHNTL